MIKSKAKIMALTDVVYKRKKDGEVVALVISSAAPKSWKLGQVIRHSLIYYKLDSVDMLSSDFKYPYRYTLLPIQHNDKNIDLIQSGTIIYNPETVPELSDKAKDFMKLFTAIFFGQVVSLMPISWQKRYVSINSYYRPDLSTGISGFIEGVIGLFIYFSLAVQEFAIRHFIDLSMIRMKSEGQFYLIMVIAASMAAEGIIRARVGFGSDQGLGSIAGMIIALPVELLSRIVKVAKKSRFLRINRWT